MVMSTTRRRSPPKPYRKRRGLVGARRRARIAKSYTYIQKYYKTSAFQLVPGTDFFNTFTFTLNGAGGNVPHFVAIYDQYRINKITIRFIPKFNEMTSNVSSSVNFISVIDYNDNNPLTGVGQAWEYQNCKMTRGTSIHTRSFKPAANAVMDAVGGGLSSKVSPWLSCANSAIPHYGVKCAVPQLPAGANALDFDLQVTYSVSFKNVR